jgi:hypothetical protein
LHERAGGVQQGVATAALPAGERRTGNRAVVLETHKVALKSARCKTNAMHSTATALSCPAIEIPPPSQVHRRLRLDQIINGIALAFVCFEVLVGLLTVVRFIQAQRF